MKTIKIKNIDDFDVVTAICDAEGFVDYEETKKSVDVLILETDVYKNIQSIENQMKIYAQQAIQAKRNGKSAKTDAEKRNFYDEYKKNMFKIEELQDQLKPLAVEFKKEYHDLVMENAKYFSLQPGEEYVDDADADEIGELMIEATQNGEVVTKEKEKIKNNKGKIYWENGTGEWIRSEIIKLGDEPESGLILESYLTDVQKQEIAVQLESERIDGLSNTEKNVEKLIVIENLVGQAGLMKAKLEVQGDNNPIGKAREWLDAETLKVEDKYK